jgi:hypothetical protein
VFGIPHFISLSTVFICRSNDELEKGFGRKRYWSEAILRNISGGTEENHENLK